MSIMPEQRCELLVLTEAFLLGCLLIIILPYYAHSAELRDISRIPQTPQTYLSDKPEAEILNVPYQSQHTDYYLQRYFTPWEGNGLDHLEISRDILINIQRNTLKRGGWGTDKKPIPASILNHIREQIDVSFASLNRNGIAVKQADMKLLPTSKIFYPSPTSPGGGYFDRLQNSTLKPGHPVRLLHRSKDGKWVFVSGNAAVGWVRAADTAEVSDEFINEWKLLPQMTFIKDNVTLLKNTSGSVIAKLGTLLPQRGNRLAIPIRSQDGYAIIHTVDTPQNAVTPFPMLLTCRNATQILGAIGPERYGWGGGYGLRDCSATIQDYASVFGIWLPRNSADQAKKGLVMELKNIPSSQRSAALLEKGIPFITLVHLPGHIMLYVGQHEGIPVVWHNLWGIHVIKNNKPARFIVGKTLFSSLRPGAEFANRKPKSFLEDRVDSINILVP